MRGIWQDPWCIVGYFNVIRFSYESNKGGRLNYSVTFQNLGVH